MYSLPRSMTQWWRWFMSHGCHALHDPLARCKHPDELKTIVDSAEGERMFIADTSAIYFHRRFEALFPGHRRVYMLRSPSECRASIQRQLGQSPSMLPQWARLMAHVPADHPSAVLHYGKIDVNRLRAMSSHVTGRAYGSELMLQLRIDKPLRQQYSNADDIRSLFSHKDNL